jgi:hypothetical protein
VKGQWFESILRNQITQAQLRETGKAVEMYDLFAGLEQLLFKEQVVGSNPIVCGPKGK